MYLCWSNGPYLLECYQKFVQNFFVFCEDWHYMVGATAKAPLRTLLFISMFHLFSLESVVGYFRWSVLRCGRLLTIFLLSNSCPFCFLRLQIAGSISVAVGLWVHYDKQSFSKFLTTVDDSVQFPGVSYLNENKSLVPANHAEIV
jgi:hypothetical protein